MDEVIEVCIKVILCWLQFNSNDNINKNAYIYIYIYCERFELSCSPGNTLGINVKNLSAKEVTFIGLFSNTK